MVSRVVIDAGYNRADDKPLWNCRECFEKKDKERLSGQTSRPTLQTRQA
ncbi:MAG TPA: hypothetical protein VGN26_01075 [Armatimonadota bacterium]|jgi:hypothetical protein